MTSSVYLLYNKYNKYTDDVLKNIRNTLHNIKTCDNPDEKLIADKNDNYLLYASM